MRGVGGPIDIATVTAGEGLAWVGRKKPTEVVPEWHEIGTVESAVTDIPPDGVTAATFTIPGLS